MFHEFIKIINDENGVTFYINFPFNIYYELEYERGLTPKGFGL